MTEDDIPGCAALRQALAEQTPLLTGPPTQEVLAVRARRVLRSAQDLVDLVDPVGHSDADDRDGGARHGSDLPTRELVARTVGWVAERIGSFHRLPRGYAEQRPVNEGRTALLTVVDELDLLGLTLDHAFAAAHAGDREGLSAQLRVVRDSFPSRTDPAHLTTPADPVVDEAAAAAVGDEVGEDGIPRMPVPAQPDPHHEPGAGAAPGSAPQDHPSLDPEEVR